MTETPDWAAPGRSPDERDHPRPDAAPPPRGHPPESQSGSGQQAGRPGEAPPYGGQPGQGAPYGGQPRQGAPYGGQPGQGAPYGGQPGWGPAPGGPSGWGAPAAGPGWGPVPGQSPGQPPGPWGAPQPQAPKPGVIPLRPLGVTELLDGAITAIRQHPKHMLGFSAVVVLVATLLQVAVTVSLLGGRVAALSARPPGSVLTQTEVTSAAAGFSGYAVLTVVINVLATLVVTGILTVVVGRAVLGRSIALGEAWRLVRPRLPHLLAVTVLLFLAVSVVWVVAVGPGVLVAAVGAVPVGVPLAVLGALAALAATLVLYTVFALAGPAVVLEKQGVREALRRSGRLVRGSFWRVLGILLLTQLISGAIGGIFGGIFALVSAGVATAIADGGTPDTFGLVPQLINAIGAVLGGTITYPFVACVTVLLYVDQRMRREGLDLELARAAVVPVPGAPAPGAPTPGPASPGG